MISILTRYLCSWSTFFISDQIWFNFIHIYYLLAFLSIKTKSWSTVVWPTIPIQPTQDLKKNLAIASSKNYIHIYKLFLTRQKNKYDCIYFISSSPLYVTYTHTHTHTHTHTYMAPFSIGTIPRCRGGRYSIPWISPLYHWSIPYNA